MNRNRTGDRRAIPASLRWFSPERAERSPNQRLGRDCRSACKDIYIRLSSLSREYADANQISRKSSWRTGKYHGRLMLHTSTMSLSRHRIGMLEMLLEMQGSSSSSLRSAASEAKKKLASSLQSAMPTWRNASSARGAQNTACDHIEPYTVVVLKLLELDSTTRR